MKKSNFEKSERYYAEHYEIIFKEAFEAEGKVYLQDHDNGSLRLCRFCGKRAPEVSFKNTAHAVPEFLGNRRILSLNECDGCNHFLANQYEDHLGRWSIIDRAIFRIQNKSKKPKYKDFDNLIRIESGEYNLNIRVVDSELTHELIKAGEPYKFKKNIEITSQSFIPIRAAMTLIKMACSLCPVSELNQCQPAINWLMNPKQYRVSKYPVLKTFTPGDINNTKSEIILLKRKVKESVPYLLCVVQYVNFRLQTFIPFCPEDSEWLYSKEKSNLNLVHYPSLFGPDSSTRITEYEVLDWSGADPTQRHITATIEINSATKIDNDKQIDSISVPTRSWKTVRFGDVVNDVKESEKNPLEAGLDRYIGLEHIEPENLHIQQWGDLTQDEISFTKRFRKGQVLFGKRRAYQRKVAVAEFDGICSSDILTFEPKGDDLIPELLPFIVQSEAFFEHALDTSSGSLSPRTRWSQLKEFEFPLPPKDEQRRIAEVIGASNEAIDSYKTVLKELMSLKSISMGRFTTRGLGNPEVIKTRLGNISAKWKVDTIKNVTTLCQYGLSIPLHEKGQFPILRMMNYDHGEIVANDLKYVDLDEKTFEEFRLERNDILFNRTNSADLVGKVGIYRLEGDFVFASYLVRLRADTEKVLPEYLNAYLDSELGQSRLLAYATPGVSQTNISAGNLKKVLIPIPPIDEQIQIVRQITAISSKRNELLNHIERCQQLKRNLTQRCLIPKELSDVQ